MQFKTVNKLVEGKLVNCEFEDLKTGDQFELYDPVSDTTENAIAESDPIPCEPKGNFSIMVTKKLIAGCL
jgi:hypothetical protein